MSAATYHVLLVGVDAYQTDRLGGCVNDIDAIQQILLGDRMAIPADHIRRLASPIPGSKHPTDVAEHPATLDNLRRALTDLASPDVRPEHRVFIYFAGHGTRVQGASPQGLLFHREALVPADCDPRARDMRLLYDFELNERLRAIVGRTRQVSLVLDCCHAAGVVRIGLDPDWKPRCLDVSARGTEPSLHAAIAGIAGGAPDADLAMVEDCQVVAACLGHQRAYEGRTSDGIRYGLFTRALIATLDATTDVALRTVTWGRLWQPIHAALRERNPGQYPTMIGHAARAVFGGPPTTGDPGLPVARTGNTYEIAAGTMARVTRGARIAVYGETPREFSLLGSRDDLASQIGVLEVGATRRGTAEASAVGPAFELPHGARGRVIRAGEDARLRCAVVPRNPGLEDRLAASPLLEVVPDPVAADVRLVQRNDRWFVTDDVHGVGDDGPPLFALHAADLGGARDVLEHYYHYVQPLMMAARATQLPGSLDLRLLSCPTRQLPASRAQDHDLVEATTRGKRSYSVAIGTRVCFQVHNRGPRRLRVTLLNSAASGRVQLLGDDVVDPSKAHTFWAHGSLGVPFEMTPPRGKVRCIDRPIAIGRTAMAHDLSYLKTERTFEDILAASRSVHRGMDSRGGDDRDGAEEWTAALQMIIETGAPTVSCA